MTLNRQWFVQDQKMRVIFSAKRLNKSEHCVYCANSTQWVRRIDKPTPFPDNVVCEECVRLMFMEPEEVWGKWVVMDEETQSVRRFQVPDSIMMAPVDIDLIKDMLEPSPMVDVNWKDHFTDYDGMIEIDDNPTYSYPDDEDMTQEYHYGGTVTMYT